jgi:hypothetical protein
MLEKLESVIEERVRAAQPIHGWDSREIARAALEAIRVPDRAALGEVYHDPDGPEARDLSRDFTAMIDAILNEKTT